MNPQLLQAEYDYWMRIAIDKAGTPEGERAAKKAHEVVVKQIIAQEAQKAEKK